MCLSFGFNSYQLIAYLVSLHPQSFPCLLSSDSLKQITDIKSFLWYFTECRLVVSNSLRPHGLYSPWNFLDQNTGVGSPSLLQGIFPAQGLNPGLPHCRQIHYQLSHQGSPICKVGLQQKFFILSCSNAFVYMATAFSFILFFNFLVLGLPWVLIAMHGLSLVVASGRHFLLQCSGFLL